MKILHLLKTSDGAAWAERQMRELVKLGVEVHAVLPPGGHLISKYKEDNINLHFLNLNFTPGKFYLLPRMVNKLKNLIEEIKPDLVHSHFVNTTIVARIALRKKNIPLLFQVPGPLHLENPFISRLEIFTARRRDFWCASSNYIKEKYLHLGLHKEKVFYAPYSPEVSKFSPKDKDKTREKLKIGKKEILIGMIAYFYPPRILLGYMRGIKGHEDLIDAIALCLRERKDIYCLMIGGPYNKRGQRYMKKVESYARKKCGDNIIFLGERNDIPDLLACLDVAVVPSLSENFGGVGEALLMEVPTIATAIGGIPEIIKHYKTGFLVPRKSPQDIYKNIMFILNNKSFAKRLAQEGRDYVLRGYNPNIAAKMVFSIYEKLVRYEYY